MSDILNPAKYSLHKFGETKLRWKCQLIQPWRSHTMAFSKLKTSAHYGHQKVSRNSSCPVCTTLNTVTALFSSRTGIPFIALRLNGPRAV